MDGTDANFWAPRAHQLCTHHNRFMRPQWLCSCHVALWSLLPIFHTNQVKVTERWSQPQCPAPQFPWSLLPYVHPGHTKAIRRRSFHEPLVTAVLLHHGPSRPCRWNLRELSLVFFCDLWNFISNFQIVPTWLSHLSLSLRCHSTQASLQS